MVKATTILWHGHMDRNFSRYVSNVYTLGSAFECGLNIAHLFWGVKTQCAASSSLVEFRKNAEGQMRLTSLIAILTLCASFASPSAYAADLTIRQCGEQALDRALSQAQDGDVVTFACSGTITLTSTKIISESILLDASDQHVVIDGNDAVRAFHITSEATVTVDHLTITGGRAESGGSAINNQGNLTLIDSVLRANVHAAANFGTMVVQGSTFADNNGVGIYSSGVLTVEGSAFAGNVHGIDNASGTATVVNSTFVDNEVTLRQGIGAGIANSGIVTVINSTFSGNAAPAGGGAIGTHRGGQVTLINSILANNGESGNCFGEMIDGGHNLQFPDSSCGDSIPVADPGLLDLADNSGPTLTMALHENSPAVGAGDADICVQETVGNVDQRGFVRITGRDETCDIGAFEFGAEPP
jgi:hypothetical protein